MKSRVWTVLILVSALQCWSQHGKNRPKEPTVPEPTSVSTSPPVPQLAPTISISTVYPPLPPEEEIAIPPTVPTSPPTTLVAPQFPTITSGPTLFPTPIPSLPPRPFPSLPPSLLPTALPTPLPTPLPSTLSIPSPSPLPTTLPSPLPTTLPSSLPAPVPSQSPTSKFASPADASTPSIVPTASQTTLVVSQSPSTITPTQLPTSKSTSHPASYRHEILELSCTGSECTMSGSFDIPCKPKELYISVDVEQANFICAYIGETKINNVTIQKTCISEELFEPRPYNCIHYFDVMSITEGTFVEISQKVIAVDKDTDICVDFTFASLVTLTRLCDPPSPIPSLAPTTFPSAMPTDISRIPTKSPTIGPTSTPTGNPTEVLVSVPSNPPEIPPSLPLPNSTSFISPNSSPRTETALSELVDARKDWEICERGCYEYELLIESDCISYICDLVNGSAIHVRVRYGDIITMAYTETGTPVPGEVTEVFVNFTIDGLHDQLEDMIGNGCIHIHYSALCGVPQEIEFTTLPDATSAFPIFGEHITIEIGFLEFNTDCVCGGINRDINTKECCSISHPCKLHDGDCQNDDECLGELICEKDCFSGEPSERDPHSWDSEDNCCVSPVLQEEEPDILPCLMILDMDYDTINVEEFIELFTTDICVAVNSSFHFVCTRIGVAFVSSGSINVYFNIKSSSASPHSPKQVAQELLWQMENDGSVLKSGHVTRHAIDFVVNVPYMDVLSTEDATLSSEEVIFGIVLGGGAISMAVLYAFLKKKNTKAHNSAALITCIAAFDFGTDAWFCSYLYGTDLFKYSLGFIAFPMCINLLLVARIYSTEFMRPEFQTWYMKHRLAVTAALMLSLTNVDVMSVLGSEILGFDIFQAPFLQKTKNKFTVFGLCGNFFEDIPQLVLQIVSIRTQQISAVTSVSMATSVLAIILGVLNRGFFGFFLYRRRVAKRTGVTTAVIPGVMSTLELSPKRVHSFSSPLHSSNILRSSSENADSMKSSGAVAGSIQRSLSENVKTAGAGVGWSRDGDRIEELEDNLEDLGIEARGQSSTICQSSVPGVQTARERRSSSSNDLDILELRSAPY